MTDIDYKRLYELSIIEKENLLIQIEEYKNKIDTLTIHLKKYTNKESNKIYYQNNKEKIIQQIKEYNATHKIKKNPEKIKEYNKKAYEKRKLKKNNEEKINEEKNKKDI
jgi:hypothetical protein